MLDQELKRIDPRNCGCTDCQTGYSKPLNLCSNNELIMLAIGILTDATADEFDAATVELA